MSRQSATSVPPTKQVRWLALKPHNQGEYSHKPGSGCVWYQDVLEAVLLDLPGSQDPSKWGNLSRLPGGGDLSWG